MPMVLAAATLVVRDIARAPRVLRSPFRALRAVPSTALRAGAEASPLRLHEVRKGLQRRFRDVVLDALGVRLRRFGRHAKRTQNVDHEPMANAHALRQRFPFSVRNTPR